jgi:hypothetical protein
VQTSFPRGDIQDVTGSGVYGDPDKADYQEQGQHSCEQCRSNYGQP